MFARTFRSMLIGLAIALTATIVAAQTADELVARNVAARGGAEKLKAIQAMKLTGTLVTAGMQFPVTILTKRPNLVRQEMRVENRVIVQAFDGTRVWTINPIMTGDEVPQEITGPQSEMMREQAEFDGPLVDYRAKGRRIAVEGPDMVGATKAVRLGITGKGGLALRMWLDADTGLVLKSASEVMQGEQRVTIETLLSDYRSVDGITIPHKMETLINGQPQAVITVDGVDLAPVVDPTTFSMPRREP